MTSFRIMLESTRFKLPFWVDAKDNSVGNKLSSLLHDLNVSYLRYLNLLQIDSYGDSEDELYDIIAGNNLDPSTSKLKFPELAPEHYHDLRNNTEVVDHIIFQAVIPHNLNEGTIFNALCSGFEIENLTTENAMYYNYLDTQRSMLVRARNTSISGLCTFFLEYGASR